MRGIVALGVAGTCAAVVAGMGACNGSSGSTAADAGEDATADATADQEVWPDTSLPTHLGDAFEEIPAPSAHDCSLDGGADPVLLCSQETALLNLVTNAYSMGTGVAPGFASSPPYTALMPHAWLDDLGLAAALGAFQCSALAYGDTVYLSMLDAVLSDLGKVLPGEIATSGMYDGEVYFRLRTAAKGFALLGEPSTGTLNHLADQYATTIASSFVTAVSGVAPDGGMGDAGTGTATVIGVPDAQNGTVAYEPARAVMAAAALLDMASRSDVGTADAGAEAALLQSEAVGALAYLWARARDPLTGLFYQSLVTSGDSGHDQLVTGLFAKDALLTDVQAWVALGLARAQAAAQALGGDGGWVAPYAAQIEALVSAMTAAHLFHGQSMSQGSSAPPPGAWLQGLVPSLGLTLTNQTTASAGLLAGAISAAQANGAAMAWTWELGGLRAALSFTTSSGVPWPPRSNLASVVTDALGDVTQVAYLTAASQDWSWATAFSPTGADAGLDADATAYSTAAVVAVVEGMTQGWALQAGAGSAPTCTF
jgi:hypothetical protein